jgi:hypothetical protein
MLLPTVWYAHFIILEIRIIPENDRESLSRWTPLFVVFVTMILEAGVISCIDGL